MPVTLPVRRRPCSRSRSGAVLVIFAASLLTFISFMALVIDVGYLYSMKARIQGVCDATAIATLIELDPAQPPAAQSRFAVALARKLLEVNGLDAHNYQIRLDPDPAGAPPHLSIGGREEMNAFFAQAIGRRTFVVGVYARAAAIKRPDGNFDATLVE